MTLTPAGGRPCACGRADNGRGIRPAGEPDRPLRRQMEDFARAIGTGAAPVMPGPRGAERWRDRDLLRRTAASGASVRSSLGRSSGPLRRRHDFTAHQRHRAGHRRHWFHRRPAGRAPGRRTWRRCARWYAASRPPPRLARYPIELVQGDLRSPNRSAAPPRAVTRVPLRLWQRRPGRLETDRQRAGHTNVLDVALEHRSSASFIPAPSLSMATPRTGRSTRARRGRRPDSRTATARSKRRQRRWATSRQRALGRRRSADRRLRTVRDHVHDQAARAAEERPRDSGERRRWPLPTWSTSTMWSPG